MTTTLQTDDLAEVARHIKNLRVMRSFVANQVAVMTLQLPHYRRVLAALDQEISEKSHALDREEFRRRVPLVGERA